MTYNVHDGYEITTNYLQAKGLVQVFPIRLGFAFLYKEGPPRTRGRHACRLMVGGTDRRGEAFPGYCGHRTFLYVCFGVFWKRGILYLSTTKADDGVRSALAMYDWIVCKQYSEIFQITLARIQEVVYLAQYLTCTKERTFILSIVYLLF